MPTKYAPPPSTKPKRGRPPLPRDKNGNKLTEPKPFPYVCVCCGKEYDTLARNFMTSNSTLFRGWSGYVPFCRECIAKYYNEQVLPAFDYNPDRAIEFVCGLYDWYVDDEMIEMAKNYTANAKSLKESNKPLIINYGSRRNMANWKTRGTTYLERCKERYAESRFIKSVEDANKISDHPDDRRAEVDERDILLFGPGYLPEEYVYLRTEYDDWKERYSCETKAQEELFKNISIAQLNVRRAQQEGEQEKTNKAMKSLNELMASAKIQPKQKTESALVDQNTFGTLIQKWENEEPIPEPAPEWRDVDGIKKYISVWLFGHLSRMFGIHNENAAEYEEEIAKYTVEPPSYHGDDEEVGESEVGKKLKAMRGKAVADQEGGDE